MATTKTVPEAQKNGIRAAIAAAGGTQDSLAAMLGNRFSRQTVSKWLRQGAVSAKWVTPVSKATGVPRADLNPLFRE